MTALGRPKSTSLDAIKKRWAGTVHQYSFGWTRAKPRTWSEAVNDFHGLPHSYQAALDVDALLAEIDRLTREVREYAHDETLRKYQEIADIVSCDGCDR